MKKYMVPGLMLILLVMLSGCNFNTSLFSIFSGSGDETGEFSLPSDMENDVLRSQPRSFAFETLLPVRLVIDVDLYSEAFELLSSEAEGVIVLVKDSGGNTVFGGVTGKNGILDQEIRLPAAPDDMTLYLHAEGFASRIAGIPDMVQYEEINRTMAMVAEGLGSRSLSGLTDSDGDGIPDVYDAYPDDKDSAFAYLMPADGYLTVAYEDLFGMAQAGDADYNDFLAHYSIEESSGDEGITSIHVEAQAAVKLAGYNHTFGIRINSFVPPADLVVNYIDEDGAAAFRSIRIEEYPNPGETSLEVVLFENTASAVGKNADFTLSFTFDDLEDNPQDPAVLSRPPYNPYLYVITTGHDVHLIDEEPIYGSDNADDTFRDADGFPWGLLVPPGEDVWSYPDEGQRIEVHYPQFTRWRESGGELSPDWYLHSEPWVEPETVPLLFSSNRDGDFEIYSLDTESGTVTQLTFNDSTDKHPALSADGSKIAFVSDFEGSPGIYTMNADGSGISGKLVDISGSFSGFPSWSPDGAQIAYNNGFEIFVMNNDVLNPDPANLTGTIFTNELEPAWSPDGTLIAFSGNEDGDFDIYTMNADGTGDPVKLTDNSAIDRKPSWSPDGTRIAFSTNIDSNYEIYTINSDGSNPVNQTSNVGVDETSPAWSMNGIAFVMNGDIYSLQPDSTDPPVNLTENAASDQDPAW